VTTNLLAQTTNPSFADRSWCGPMWTFFATVLTGVLILLIGQYLLRLIVEPIHDQKKALARLMNALTIYKEYWLFKDQYKEDSQARNRLDQASDYLSEVAAQLRTTTKTIPFYSFWERIRVVRNRHDIDQLVQSTLRWRAFNSKDDVYEMTARISTLLGVGEQH
jgi:hypothetical protein